MAEGNVQTPLYSGAQIKAAVDFCCMLLKKELEPSFQEKIVIPILRSTRILEMDKRNWKDPQFRHYPDEKAIERFREKLTKYITEAANSPHDWHSKDGYGGCFLEQGWPHTLILHHAPSSSLLFDDIIKGALEEAGIAPRSRDGNMPLPHFAMHLYTNGEIQVFPAISHQANSLFAFRVNYRAFTEPYAFINPAARFEGAAKGMN